MKDILLHKRMKSLYWRVGTMALAVLTAGLADNLDLFNLSMELTMFLGLVLGEITKALHK